jgi:hypothetical protein
MYSNRRKREQENLPVLLEMVSYTDPDNISTTEVAKKFGITQQRAAALLRGLLNGTNSWVRVASAYGLPESRRPRWVGAGTTASVPPPIPHTPTPTSTTTVGVGQVAERSLARTLARKLDAPPDLNDLPHTNYQPQPVTSTRRLITIDDEPAVMIDWSDGRHTIEHLSDEEICDYRRSAIIRSINEKNSHDILEDLKKREELDAKERELHRRKYGPWTPKEEAEKKAEEQRQQEQLEQVKVGERNFMILTMMSMNSTPTVNKGMSKQEIDELIEILKSSCKQDTPPGPTAVEWAQAIVESVKSNIQSLLPSPDIIKKAIEEVEGSKVKEQQDRKEAIILLRETRDELQAKKRKRQHRLFPLLYPDDD